MVKFQVETLVSKMETEQWLTLTRNDKTAGEILVRSGVQSKALRAGGANAKELEHSNK